MPEDNFQLNTPALPGTVMPFSAEAEQAVLGAVLLEPDCLSTVAEMLPRADYFYQVNNRTIYSAMLDMFTAGQPVDLVTLLEHLREEENFDEGSGKVYLMQLAQLVPSVSNVERYCTIVRDRYDLRMLIQAARGILDDAMEDTGETSLLLDSAEQRIFDIRQGKALKGLERLNEVLFETFERLDRLNSPDKDLYRGIPTGIRELDNTITGLNRSDLVIIGARPGMGKTSFALNIARHAAITAGKRVAFFSLEMSKTGKANEEAVKLAEKTVEARKAENKAALDLANALAFCLDKDLLLQNFVLHAFGQESLTPFALSQHQAELLSVAGFALA